MLATVKLLFGQRFEAVLKLAYTGGQPAHPGEVTLVFDQPVQPGSTVTVALPVQQNPSWVEVSLSDCHPVGEHG